MSAAQQMSELIRALDPAETSAQLDPRTDPRAQAVLARTTATGIHGPGLHGPGLHGPGRPRVRRPSRRRLALIASVAAAAAAVAVVPSFVGGAPGAAWSAVPVTDEAAAAAATKACAAEVTSMPSPSEMGAADLSDMVPILSDVRGPLVLVYLTDGRDGGELTCYYENGEASFAGSVANAGAPQAAAVPAGSVRGSGGSIVSTDLGDIRAVTGRTGADVVSVVLDTVAKGRVTATVTGGRFAAWWPDDSVTDATENRAGPGDELRGVEVTLRDGTVRSIPVAELLGR